MGNNYVLFCIMFIGVRDYEKATDEESFSGIYDCDYGFFSSSMWCHY